MDLSSDDMPCSPLPSSSLPPSDAGKQRLGWMEWARGWQSVVGEFFFQRIAASHLENPLPLPPLDGITFVVTGATSGIGLEIARQLAQSGGHVVMAVRRTKLAQELIQKWQDEMDGAGPLLNVEVMELDLLSLGSVVRFAEKWNARMAPLNVLINNAGIFSIGGTQDHMHTVGFVDINDMNATLGKRKYSSLLGYTTSKLAQVKFSSILQKRLPSEAGISVICTSPGIVHTNVARDLPRMVQIGYNLIPYFIFNAQEGARSTLFASTDPQVPEYCETLKADEWPVCAYISYDCRPVNTSEEAYNLATSEQVWEKTLELIGLPADALEKLIEGEEVECRFASED